MAATPIHEKIIGDAVTFDDVLLVPAHADFHPRDADVSEPVPPGKDN